MTFERGQIVWMNFSAQKGHEQAGCRPALVISPSGNCSPRYAARSYCLIMSAAFPSSAIWMASIGLYPSSAIEPR